ncbi:hypothetical protein KJ866_03175, partial [Patescibacteria group bacterium]|nr:hypothetical protein [Patescibacteria group bacterium]
MPEQFKPYNFDQAREEATKMEEKIKSGEADNYNKAEKLGENEKTKNKEIILTPGQQEGFKKLHNCIRRYRTGEEEEAMEIIKNYSLNEEVLYQEIKKNLLKSQQGSSGWRSLLLSVRTRYVPEFIFFIMEKVLKDKEVVEVHKKELIEWLKRSEFTVSIEIIADCLLKDEIKKSQEITNLIKGMLFNEYLSKDFVSKYGISNGQEFITYTYVDITPQEIVSKFPDLESVISVMDTAAPGFREKIYKSPIDLVLNLLVYRERSEALEALITKYPFLVESLLNSHFGSKLFLKFPKLDYFSRVNIEFQFKAKKKILSENPEMDPESLEFRQLMQEELKKFKNNPEIMAAIKKEGINLDEWLNYSETSYFNLSTGGSEIAFSEKIRTPIDRIKETIDSYAHTIKSVLKEYRPEMEKYEIVLEEASPIEAQIAKMEAALEQAKTEDNEKKMQGIERGLASQKEKLNNLKKGWLWDKLTGEVAAFQRLKNDCFEAQNRLMEAENKLEQALSGKMPSGKMIQDIKQAITSSKEELRNKFNDLESRIEEFKTNLPNLISPCLGQERSEALIQEINQKVAEQFNHFESDRTTVANLFSERGDKETSQLESRPMSIFVWARNPDIDLYQGNYSPCCICIDSAHMGAESTIADYNTDLGIQIVNIWDETKNEPVTATWCWLGQNAKGEKALVIDNIESNTLYSSNFSEQLSNELFEYIKDYAKKIGVDKVVLGKANNDLPTGSGLAKLSEDNGQYEKIGGSNRSDGYFLEAEEKSVKLVWQAEEKKVTEKKAKETPKVEFKNLKVESISDKNLARVLQTER